MSNEQLSFQIQYFLQPLDLELMSLLLQFIEAGKCFGEAIFASIFGGVALEAPLLTDGEIGLGEPTWVESCLLALKKALAKSDFFLLHLGAVFFDELAALLVNTRFFFMGVKFHNLAIRKDGPKIIIAQVNPDEEKLMLAGIFLFLTGREFMLGNPSGTCRKRKINIILLQNPELTPNPEKEHEEKDEKINLDLFLQGCPFEYLPCVSCPYREVCHLPFSDQGKDSGVKEQTLLQIYS